MSGLVPMAEYRKVVERCDQLEEELAYYRSLHVEDAAEDRIARARRAFHIGPQEARALLLLVDRAPKLVLHHTFEVMLPVSADVVGPRRITGIMIFKLRAAFRANGCPVGIRTIYKSGYSISEEHAAWLRDKIGDPQQRKAA